MSTKTGKTATKLNMATRPKNESGSKKIAADWQGGPKGKSTKTY